MSMWLEAWGLRLGTIAAVMSMPLMVFGGEQKLKALVIASEQGGAAVTSCLAGTGMNTSVASDPQKVADSIDGRLRLIVLTADFPVPDEQAARIARFVQAGGGLLVVHTAEKDPNYWWNTYRRLNKDQPNLSPLWRVLPFTTVPICDQKTHGIRNPFGPTKVGRQAGDPLLKGVDLTQAPTWPYHSFMVLPTHPILQGTHLFFGWSEDQLKDSLWTNGRVLAWGDDPEQRPLLLTAEYGAGRAAAAAVPLFTPEFIAWKGSTKLLKNLAEWLTGGNPELLQIGAMNFIPQRRIFGIGVPWIVQDSLARMGYAIVDTPERVQGALVYGVPTIEQAWAVRQLAVNHPVVIANPAALEVQPLKDRVQVQKAAAPPPAVQAVAAVKLHEKPVSDLGAKWEYAVDLSGVGETEKWYADAPGAKWFDRAAELRRVTSGKRPPDPEKRTVEWSANYRYRYEGNILDRRDFIEGWQRPDYDDSRWAEAERSKQPPVPTILGQQPPAMSLFAGALWRRHRFTILSNTATREIIRPISGPRNIVMLDGKPIDGPVPLSALSPGGHLIAVRTWPAQEMLQWANEHPWGREPYRGGFTIDRPPFLHRAADRGEDDAFQGAFHPEWSCDDLTPEGTGWYQLQLEIAKDQPENSVPLRITGEGTDSTAWFDGAKLGPLPATLDLPATTNGLHVLTLLKKKPGEIRFAYPPMHTWVRVTFTLPDDQPWNALSVEQQPRYPMYVNGERLTLGSIGLVPAPLRPGKNTLVSAAGVDLETARTTGGWMPAMRLASVPDKPLDASVPDAQRLCGVWFTRDDPEHEVLKEITRTSTSWAGISGDIPPAGWRKMAVSQPEKGMLASLPDEGARWFAAPFIVSEAEARGPARLLIDTTGKAVPTDLVKTIWVNGKPVDGFGEFAATDRYESERGKATIISFIIAGLLKPGTNWLAFPADFQGVYGLRMPVPAGLGWTLPLPKLDFSGTVDRVAWAEPYTRLNGLNLVRRGALVVPPKDAAVLARFSDGAPAVARIDTIVFATADFSADWARYIEKLRLDWATTSDGKNSLSPFNMWPSNHIFTDAQQPDPAQIPATLLLDRPMPGGVDSRGYILPDDRLPVILGASFDPATRRTTITLKPDKLPRLIGYRIRNWMGMLLAEGTVPVPAKAASVALPAPAGDPSPISTELKREWFVRVALLPSPERLAVLDYLEARLDVRPPVDVLLATTDQLRRDLPADVPGSTTYDPKYLQWNLSTEKVPVPVVVPGERILLRAMFRNTTGEPQQVKADLAWQSGFGGKAVPLRKLAFTLAPREQRTELIPCGFRAGDMEFMALPSLDPAPLREKIEGVPTGPAMVAGQVVATMKNRSLASLALTAVRPWKDVSADAKLPDEGSFGAPAGFEMGQFSLTATLESLADPKHRWWDSELGGNFYSAIDWWRDHLINTQGNGGGYGGFNGKADFAWGRFDVVWESSAETNRFRLALDNASYLPDGTQYMEWLYARVQREYNRCVRGTKPLRTEVADFWASCGINRRERNLIHFLRWQRERGRPLNVSTADELRQLIDKDAAVADDWRQFGNAGYDAWSKQIMAAMPPGSINGSQGESFNYMFTRAHDNTDGVRSVLASHCKGIFQPFSLRRRGESIFSFFRAFNSNYYLGDGNWYYSTGHSQTAGEAWGENGSIFASPEWARLMILDCDFMGVKEDDGELHPLANLPLHERLDWGPIPMFSRQNGDSASIPADMLTRETTYHLHHLIQPERLLGAYVVPSLERAVADKLDGSTVDFGLWKPDTQPIVGLTHVLRNYGALWGGYVAPDRLNLLKPGEGAIYVMPSGAGDAEAKPIADLVRNGGYAAVFFSTGGTKTKETALSDLFGVACKPQPTDRVAESDVILPGGERRPYLPDVFGVPQFVAAKPGKDVLTASGSMSDRVLLREVESGKGRAIFSPMNAKVSWGWDHRIARELARAVNWAAGNPVTLPEGVGGYAFEAKGMTFIVLQDLKCTGGEVRIGVNLPKGRYAAADVFAGTPVPIAAERGGLALRPTLPPNGGALIAIRRVE